jgi:predicted DCC family thiol-disulfide oxidoreductase YuxK
MQKCEHDLSVYYDGSCSLCQAEIAHYRRQPGAEEINFVDVSSSSCDPGPGLVRDTAMARFHVRTKDGTLLSGAEAFARIWAQLPNLDRQDAARAEMVFQFAKATDGCCYHLP